MHYSDILSISMAALQLMFYKARASSLLQCPDPVPSRLSRGTGQDGTDRDGIFKMGRDCAFADLERSKASCSTTMLVTRPRK